MRSIVNFFGLSLLIVLFSGCNKKELPGLVTSEIINFDNHQATAGGNITSDGNSGITDRGVCWGLGVKPSVTGMVLSEGTGEGIFSVQLTRLKPGLTYYVQAYATNSSGIQYGQIVSFKTIENVAVISDYYVSDITTTSAIVHASVNAWSLSTTVTFEYGRPYPYVSSAPAIENPLTQNGFVNVSAVLKDLLPFSTYQYRIKAVNEQGTSYFDASYFQTSGGPPTIRSFSLTDITTNSVNVRAIINPWLLESTVVIEYGTSSAYGSTATYPQSPLTGGSDIELNTVIDNLVPGTKYFFRVKAFNQTGTNYGNELSCTTNN